jgi:D-alanyl-D-alanine carboxypeptidase
LFIAAAGYLVYIFITEPERLNIGGARQLVPALAEVDEFGDEEAEPEIDNPFEEIVYYIPAYLNEYISFRAVNPYMDDSEIVWRVNARLHLNAFYDAEVITYPNPLLVNPYHRLPDSFIPIELEVIDEHGRLAAPEAIRAFRLLQEAGALAGHNIRVQSAYRTIDRQRELYEQSTRDGAVARPGFSEHHTGRALDLAGPDGLLDINGPSPTGRWVAEHAHEFGFIIRYPAGFTHITGYIYEPWHITYVGTEISNMMHENGYSSLEEFVAKNPDMKLP